MKVICENFKECEYKKLCSHAKIHKVIAKPKDSYGSANNCVFDHIGVECFCSSLYLRKEKLKKLNKL